LFAAAQVYNFAFMKVPYYGVGIALFSQFILPIAAYSISLDCEDPSGLPSKTTDVQNAIEAWKKMAAYSIGRAADTNQQHRQGNLLQAMLGAPSENDQSTLTYVTSKSPLFPFLRILLCRVYQTIL
jgi:hypothetical protein